MIRRSPPIRFFSWLMRLAGRRAPAVSPAGPQDAPQFAALHAAAFQRGWSAEEFERLLIEPNVVADRAMAGSRLAGFVLSRLAADQAEILSIAVAVRDRRRGLAGKLLDVHLHRLTGYGTRSLFLEVDERNLAARRLYAGFGFAQVGVRKSYYAQADQDTGAALVLRRDLA
jgi:ribosomal-protein-alanine N-acetyltransferase